MGWVRGPAATDRWDRVGLERVGAHGPSARRRGRSGAQGGRFFNNAAGLQSPDGWAPLVIDREKRKNLEIDKRWFDCRNT